MLIEFTEKASGRKIQIHDKAIEMIVENGLETDKKYQTVFLKKSMRLPWEADKEIISFQAETSSPSDYYL